MADNLLQLVFKADTEDLDKAKEKLSALGDGLPTVGDLIKGLGKVLMDLPGPIGVAAAGMTAFAVGAAELAKKAGENVDALMEMSAASGVSVENLQVMKTAMGLTGASTEMLGTMLNRLNKTIGEAADPYSKAGVAMHMLGVSQAEIAKGDTNEIMTKVSKNLSEMAPSANKAALEMAVFGKSGAEADEMIKSFNENADKARQILADHGAVTTDDVAAQKTLNAAIAEASAVFQGLGLAVLREVLPAITSTVQWFDNVTKVSGPLAQTIKQVWTVMKEIGSALVELATPVINLAQGLVGIGVAFLTTGSAGTEIQARIQQLNKDFQILVTVLKVVSVAVYGVVETLAVFAEGVIRTAKALNDLTTLDVKAAAHAFDGFTDSLKNGLTAIKDFANQQFPDDLQEIVVTAKKMGDASEAAGKSVGNLTSAMKQLEAQKVVDDLNQKWADQRKILDAATISLDAYKAIQNEVAIDAELLKQKQAGAGVEQLKQMEAALRGAAAEKEATTQQVAGLQMLMQLKQQIAAFDSHDTETEKVKALIAADKEMTKETQEQLLEEAKLLDAKKQQQTVDEATKRMTDSVIAGIAAEQAAMTLSTNQLKLYNAEAKLTAQYNKDIVGKTPDQIKQLDAALLTAKKTLQDNNTATQQWTQSLAGFGAGAKQAFGNFAEGALNANKLGNQFVTQGLDGMANALSEVGTKGKSAFTDLAVSMAKMVEQAAAKILIVEGIATAVTAIWGQGAGDAVWELAGGKPKGFANGGAFNGGVQAFADGGVVGGPTYFNMGLMGEAGPEAIMPLSRGSDGKLGVAMNGGNSSSPSETHIHGPTIHIHSDKEPHEIAKEVKKQDKFASAKITQQLVNAKRPGGPLHNKASYFAS